MTTLDDRPTPPAEAERVEGSEDYREQVEITQEMAAGVPRSVRGLVRQARDDYRLIAATKYGVTPMLVLLAITFLDGIDKSILGLAAPEIRRDFNVTLTQLALIGSLFGSFGALLVPVIGILNDRVRRTRLVGGATILSGAISMASVVPRTYVPFMGLRSFDNLADQGLGLPAATLMYDYYPVEARGKVVALRAFITGIAGLITGPIVGLSIAVLGWRAAYFGVAVPFTVSGLLAFFFLKEPVRGYWERVRAGVSEEYADAQQPPMKAGEAFRTLMKIKTLRRTIAILPILLVSGSGFSFLFNYYLREQFHLGPFQRSLIGIPSSILGLFFIIAGGSYADGLIKRGPRRVLVLQGMIGILTTISHLLIVLVPWLPLFIVSGVVISLLGNLLTPATATATSLIVPPRLRGQGLSMFVLVLVPLGLVLGPLPAYVADHYSLRTGMLVFGPLQLLGSLLSISASRYINVDMRAALASANATNEYNEAKRNGLIRLLLVRDVDVAYDNVQVLFNVNLTVDEGETIALLGTNGAGKSTLLRAISGITEADVGAIFFDGVEITHLPPHEIARLGIVHMPGGKCVFPSLTVRDNLDLARLHLAEDDDTTARLDHVFELFPKLRERLDQQAGTLSGGEQQMVGLAQAFLWKPRLLMIDELSLGLSPAIVGELLDTLREIQALGTTIVLVEQSVNVALTVAERAVFMEKGQVRFDGRTADLLARPDIMRAVYLKGSGALTERRRAAEAELPTDRARVILECDRIGVGYGGVKALQNVTFDVHEGEVLGLIGPNGSGKTTLFDVISGFLPPDTGHVRYDGNDITRMPPTQRARLGLIRRFQEGRLFASLTVFEAVCVALDRQLDTRSTFLTALQLPAVRRSEGRVKARADRLIDLLDLGDYRDKFVSELSTGLRRVVDLACVLAAEPRLLLLDEPSSGIAQAEAESLGPLLRRIRYETGCSILIIEHDMPLIRSVADELMALVLGQVVARGPADAVLEHPVVVDAYLGTSEEALHRSGLRKR